jgi:branched-chain amino acid transport system substrate-binding protein
MKRLLARALTGMTFLWMASSHAAEPPLKIGLIGPFTGISAENGGAPIEHGIKTFLKMNGDTVAGRKVEIIRRDVPAPAPDLAKRVATELVVRDKVDFLVGVIFTPNALAVGQVAAATKTPFVIMNAATSGIMPKIPYSVRTSFTLAQVSWPLGRWAARNGSKRAFTVVADYAPGVDAEKAFGKTFTEGGGTIVDTLRSPLENIEFSSYVRRIKDAKADAVYLFLPAGDTAKGFLKAFKDSGLAEAGVKILADGGVTAPNNLPILGENAIGVISSHHYSEAHDSPLNREFVKTFAEITGGQLPTYISAGAYDGMAAIYKAVQMQNGKLDPDRSVEIMSSLKLESPRGTIEIDPKTRDVTQNVYIRRVERRGNTLLNIEFETIPTVKPS